MQAIFLAAALAAAPSPAPLKTIVNVHSRDLCTVLREKLGPAIGGILANDTLTRQGQAVMERLVTDSKSEYAGALGGEGSVGVMDNMRIENDVSGLVANIGKIEKILDGATYRGQDAADAAAFEAARARLNDVLAKQKAELNILSFVAFSNQGRDLQAMQDPTGGAFNPPPPSLQADMTPVALPQQMRVMLADVQRAESVATQVLTPIIQSCR